MSGKMRRNSSDKAYEAFFDYSADFSLAELFVKAHRGSSDTFVTGHSKGAASAAWVAATLPGVTGVGINGPGIGHCLNAEQKKRLEESGFRTLINRRDLIGPAFHHPEPAVYVDYKPALKHGRKIDGDTSGHNLQTIVYDPKGFAVRVEKPKLAAEIEAATSAACSAIKTDGSSLGLPDTVTDRIKKIFWAALEAQRAFDSALPQERSREENDKGAALLCEYKHAGITDTEKTGGARTTRNVSSFAAERAPTDKTTAETTEEAIKPVIPARSGAEESDAKDRKAPGEQPSGIVKRPASPRKKKTSAKKVRKGGTGISAVRKSATDSAKRNAGELMSALKKESKACANRIYNEIDHRIRAIWGKLLTEEEAEKMARERNLAREELKASQMEEAIRKQKEQIDLAWEQWHSERRNRGFDSLYSRCLPDFMKSAARKNHERMREAIEKKELDFRNMEAEHKAFRERLHSINGDLWFLLSVEQEVEKIREEEQEQLAELEQLTVERNNLTRRRNVIDNLVRTLPWNGQNMELDMTGNADDMDRLVAQAEQMMEKAGALP